MARGIFITGTDTGVGKSLVACALIEKFKALNLKVAGMKPVASGSSILSVGLRNEDALAIQRASNVAADYSLVNPYCFEPPIAPHIAAKQAGVSIDLARLQNCYDQLSDAADVVIVEGAGGWRVPLESGYLCDFPEQAGLEVVLVVGMRLGCLNHALLTAEAVISGGKCTLVGWVANLIDPHFQPIQPNLELLEQRLTAPLLGVIPFKQSPNPRYVADLLDIPVSNPRQ
jgi:dethiobiotin synthetase